VLDDLPLTERLNAILRDGTEKQRGMVGYILSNLRQCSYASARELASRCGVDGATIIRLGQRLGFDRYNDFRESLRASYLGSLEPIDLLQEQSHIPSTDIVKMTLQQDLRLVSRLLKTVDQPALHGLAARISAARRILVIGFGEHGGIAYTLGHLLSYLGLDAVLETRGSIALGAQVTNLGPDDLLVAFSFWRPTKDTVQALTWSRDQGIPTAVINDSAGSRAAVEATHVIVVPSEAISFFHSMAAALAVVQVLVALVAAQRGDRAKEAIRRSRAYNREFGLVTS